jgi:hypothetical protein
MLTASDHGEVASEAVGSAPSALRDGSRFLPAGCEHARSGCSGRVMRVRCRLTAARFNARIDNPLRERIGKIIDVRERKTLVV